LRRKFANARYGWFSTINLTGDYVWSDRLDLDANGFMPMLVKPLP